MACRGKFWSSEMFYRFHRAWRLNGQAFSNWEYRWDIQRHIQYVHHVTHFCTTCEVPCQFTDFTSIGHRFEHAERIALWSWSEYKNLYRSLWPGYNEEISISDDFVHMSIQALKCAVLESFCLPQMSIEALKSDVLDNFCLTGSACRAWCTTSSRLTSALSLFPHPTAPPFIYMSPGTQKSDWIFPAQRPRSRRTWWLKCWCTPREDGHPWCGKGFQAHSLVPMPGWSSDLYARGPDRRKLEDPQEDDSNFSFITLAKMTTSYPDKVL